MHQIKHIDVGHAIFYRDPKDAREKDDAYFINISSCGSSAMIAKIANDTPKFLGGAFVYYSVIT